MKTAKTGEVPTLSSIYAYLNANIELKADMIPFIAVALGVFKQEFSLLAQKILKKLSKNYIILYALLKMYNFTRLNVLF